MTSLLVTVTAPHYTASLVTVDGVCTEAAPILRWAIGKPWRRLREHFLYKGFRFSEQPDPSPRQTP